MLQCGVISREINSCLTGDFKYADYLERSNKVSLEKTKQLLLPLREWLEENQAIAVVTGSDGRGEKGYRSKTEVVFIQDENPKRIVTPTEVSQFFIEKNGKDFSEVFDTCLSKGPIILKIGRDKLSMVDNDSNRIYPDRVLCSKLVIGDEEIHKKAKEVTLIESSLTKGLSGKIRKALRSQRGDYLKTCQTGVSRNQRCFDEQQQYYRDDQKGVYGFKHGFIRLVQRDIDLRIQGLVRDQVISVQEAIVIPNGTVDRLTYLLENSENIIEAYLWFLQNYHNIQRNYMNGRTDLASLEFDPYILRECFNEIKRLEDDFTYEQ